MLQKKYGINIQSLIDEYYDNKELNIPQECSKLSIIDVNICPNCKKFGLFVDEGIIMCKKCSCQYGSNIEDNAEWRSYDESKGTDNNRCGAAVNPLLIESSYGTSIAFTNNNYFNHLKQLANWQSMPYHERSLKIVFDRLTHNGMFNGLTPNIIDYSHKLFSNVINIQNNIDIGKLSRGDNRDGLISACLFYSCKEFEVSRSPKEIGKICQIKTSDVTRGINLFYELMKSNVDINLNKNITKYSDFVERYCNNLEIKQDIIDKIITIANTVDLLKILTKNTPQSMACGCIYFGIIVHNLNITKCNIAEKCGISVPTITKSYERLLDYTSKII
jgi:transcription initiation factor TFIIB